MIKRTFLAVILMNHCVASLAATLDLSPLMQAPAPEYDYKTEFKQLDVNALIQDLKQVMTESQDWWPADYGHYGPFFIRMTWHAAGTYRIFDGQGGIEGAMQRFTPLNSWPDNTNLDKARRLLWPIKQKYGRHISWSDLMALAGNVALESMGFKTIGFAFGRHDAYRPEIINWGPENHRNNPDGQLKKPYAATQMGLIYVNPEGPDGHPDPIAAAKHIRLTFARMAMNDEETVALIAGGHAFGKAHGAAPAAAYLGPAPEAAPIEDQGLGWKSTFPAGTITSGLEGAWSANPIHWSHQYLEHLFHYHWVQTTSPGHAIIWIPDDKNAAQLVPDAHDASKRHPPIMFTTDLALKFDPSYRQIAERFLKHPQELEQAFAKAWFKLIHRDMGPRSRYLGPLLCKEVFIWQDPIPDMNAQVVDANEIQELKKLILNSGLQASQLIKTAWAAASSFRISDRRGGANGARIALEPQISWPVNQAMDLKSVLKQMRHIQDTFNQSHLDHKISLADLIILAGDTAIEEAAHHRMSIPFKPGRTDASQDMTDISSFAVLEPHADAFRNYYEKNQAISPEQMMVYKASQLNLTAKEMAVLLAGLRVLNTNYDGSDYGVLTKRPGQLSNDFFVNLLNNNIVWQKSVQDGYVYEAKLRKGKDVIWRATAVDLIFGADAQLRAIAEDYASAEAEDRFLKDFALAWAKVMDLDRS